MAVPAWRTETAAAAKAGPVRGPVTETGALRAMAEGPAGEEAARAVPPVVAVPPAAAVPPAPGAEASLPVAAVPVGAGLPAAAVLAVILLVAVPAGAEAVPEAVEDHAGMERLLQARSRMRRKDRDERRSARRGTVLVAG